MTEFINSERNVDTGLKLIRTRILDELSEEYPDVKYDPDDLVYSMDRFYRKSKVSFVIVIDEWDAVFRIWKSDVNGQTKYLDFLRDLLKDKPYVALAYMTGILPIKKYGQHSALNMFTEYSMMFPRQLAKYTGFTEDEVANECYRYGRDFESVKNWYNGYEVSDIIPPDPGHKEQTETGRPLKSVRYSLYSPLSVVEAMTTGIIKNYWNKTTAYAE